MLNIEKFYLAVNRYVMEFVMVIAMLMFILGMNYANADSPNKVWMELYGIEQTIADEFKNEE